MHSTQAPDVVLIGNGPSATKHYLGQLIDSARLICRINNYVLAGFEDRIGSRTDLRIVNQGILFNDGIRPSCPNTTTVLACGRVTQEVAEAAQAQHVPLWFWNAPFIPADKWASTGLVALWHLSLTARVGIIGFDCFQAQHHHYWQEGSFCGHHSPEAEQLLVNNLIRQGRAYLLAD